MGQSDVPHQKPVKMYCAKCEDIYNPKATRHATIDGAYFGSSFHNILFQVYPALVPEKSRSRHVPRVFGFKVHVAAALARWQDGVRVRQKKRLREAGVENVGFVEDGEDGEEGEEGEEELEGAEDGLMEEDDEAKPEQAGDHVMDEVAKI
jgi:casein kinase II subunit beta